jgi:hypothetical protein
VTLVTATLKSTIWLIFGWLKNSRPHLIAHGLGLLLMGTLHLITILINKKVPLLDGKNLENKCETNASNYEPTREDISHN